MISFKFNETKTTQIAAFFIKQHGDKLNYTKLIKLLYLADREALSRWQRPLTGDSYVSMHNGPVLSKTYELIEYKEDPNNKSYWYRFISKQSYDVGLIKEPSSDELSKREVALIEKIHEAYKNKDWRQMIDICHKVCPEWKDPGYTSRPLDIESILKELNKTEEEIEIIREEAFCHKYTNRILCQI